MFKHTATLSQVVTKSFKSIGKNNATPTTTMTLKETNYIETINGYSAAQWQPLLELIPEIENATDFGEINEDKPDHHEPLVSGIVIK